MRTGMLRWLVLAIGILALAGCRRNHSVAVKITPVPPPQPFVFYDETGDPSESTPALSEVELREIIAWVAAKTSDPIWLIRVKPARPGEQRGWVIAHLVPDETTPRIRAGRAYYVPQAKQKTGNHPPRKYLQVSMANRSFTDRFTKPSATELPFEWPAIADPNSSETSPISKEELLAIVDVARRPSSYQELTGGAETSKGKMVETILKSPVFWVLREDEGIGVMFGFQHAPLWGHGWEVLLERTTRGYKVKGWGSWVS